jgi:hypothetical protein
MGGSALAQNVGVDVYEIAPSSVDLVANGITNSSGVLTLTGLLSGHKYVLRADLFANQGEQELTVGDIGTYASTWLGSTLSYDQAPAGSFTATSSVSKTISLKAGFSVTGVLTDPDSNALTNGQALVQPYRYVSDASGEYFEGAGYTFSDSADGSYRASSLRPGEYVVLYTPPSEELWGAIFNGGGIARSAAPHLSIASADVVHNEQFSVAGQINGVVTLNGDTPDADPSFGAYAEAFAIDESDLVPVAYSYVDTSTGYFTINAAPGSYRVRLTTFGGDFASEWYDNAATLGDAEVITVPVNASIPAFMDLGMGFTISGSVTREGGAPIAGYDVTVDWQDGINYGSHSTTTASDGSYEIDNVDPGSYIVSVSDPSGTDTTLYATNAGVSSDVSEAAALSGVDGTLDVNFEFPISTTVDVTVVGPTGAPINNAYVIIFSVESDDYVWAETLGGGKYRLTGVEPGVQYAPYIYTQAAGTYTQYLGGGLSEDESELVSFVPGSNSFRFSLSGGQVASGKVTGSNGKGVKGSEVFAYYYTGSDWDGYDIPATTSSTGAWSFTALRPGSYRFYATPPTGSTDRSTFYGGTADFASATSVYIGPGKSFTGSIKLLRGGKITGSLAGESGGPAFGDGYVFAHKLEGTPGAFTSVRPENISADLMSGGRFSIVGLESGYYAISYAQDADDPIYPTSWIGGTDPLTTATAVKVTAGKTTAVPLWRASAHPGLGSISGTLTANGGGPLPAHSTVYVSIQGANNEFYDSGTLTGKSTFSFYDLPDGDYVVSISGEHWDTDPTTSYESAAVLVTVSGGATTPVTIPLDDFADLSLEGVPVVFGDLKVGATLDADTASTNKPTDVTFQWYRQPDGPDTRTAIRGATSSEYEIQPSDYGSVLYVRETYVYRLVLADVYVDYQYTTVLVGAGLVGLGDAPYIAGYGPSLSPSSNVTPGTVLTVDPGQWGPNGTKFSYTWYVDNVEQVGKTGPTFTVTDDLVENSYTVKVGVRASRENSAETAEYTDSVSLTLGAAPVAITPPVVSHVGSKYTVKSRGTWNTPNLTFAYQWYEDGVPVGGATTSSFTRTAPTKLLSVSVATHRNGFHTGSRVVLAALGDAAPTTTTAVVVVNQDTSDPFNSSFTATVGQRLTALDGYYEFPDGSTGPVTRRYQWQSSSNGVTWSSISGAKSKDFTIPVSLLNKQLRVMVMVSSPSYAQYSAATEPGTVVASTALDTVTTDTEISGPTSLGRTVRAVPSHYNVTGLTFSYQWLVDGSLVPGATGTAFVLTSPTVVEGSAVSVEVTAHKAGYVDDSRVSSDLIVTNSTIKPLTLPTITQGTVAKAGTTLSAKPGTWDVTSPTFQYAWWVLGVQEGSGSTFKPTPDMAGSEVALKVRATKSGYPTSDWVDATAALYLMPSATGAAPTAIPFVLNTPAKVGSALTVTDYPYDVFTFADNSHAKATLRYQWYRGSGAISGATSRTYTPKTTDVGRAISVKVSSISPFFAGSSYTTDPVTIVLGDAPVGGIGVDYTTPDVRPGTKLTATHAVEWGPGVTFSYQWKRSFDGGTTWNDIPAGTRSTYVVTTADPESLISVAVTGARAGYGSTSAWTSPISVLYTDDLRWFTAPTIGGNPTVGGTVTAVPGVLNATGASVTYTWLLNGKPIPGAKSSTLVIAPAFYGHTLTVQISAAKAGYVAIDSVSDSAVVLAARSPLVVSTKKPTITGGATTSATYTVSTGAWTVSGATYSYEWFRGLSGDTSTPLVTTATYSADVADIGNVLWVRVTAKAYGYNDGTFNTAATHVIATSDFCV